MKNFSDENVHNLETSKDRTINLVRSKTGLSEDIICKIYESQKIDGVSDDGIINYFDDLTQEKQTISVKEFFGSFVNGLSGIEGNLSDIKKSKITEGLLIALDDFANSEKSAQMLNSVELLSAVKQLLELKNPELTRVFSESNSLLLLSDAGNRATENYAVLSESLKFSYPEIERENDVKLFENLKTILMKNNKRWGNAYHIQSTYAAIMNYIDQELEQVKIAESMVSADNAFHIELINDMLSGNVSPLHKSISSIKHLVPDLQTVVFDMTLLITRYLYDNQSALNLIARQTVNDYDAASRNLIACIASSRVNSKILSDTVKTRNFSSDSNNLLRTLIQSIDGDKTRYNVYDIPLKGIVDMINLIKSSSTEFNLKIRPVIRQFVTKAYELTSKVEKANYQKSKLNK